MLIALLAIIGAALNLSGGLAAAYWICFGLYTLCWLIVTACKIIGSSDSCKDPVNDTKIRTGCGNKAAYLGHEYNKGGLSHIC